MGEIRRLGRPEPEPPLQPQTKDEVIAAQQQQIELLEARLRSALALLNDPQRLTTRAIALLNGKHGLGFAFAAGAIAALLLMGSGLSIKAVYDAAHQPPPAPVRTVGRPVLVPYEVSGDPRPSPSPSPSPSPQPGVPVAAVRPSPSPSPPVIGPLPPIPVPSPSVPPRKHCPIPPPVPPRCPSPPPTPPIPTPSPPPPL